MPNVADLISGSDDELENIAKNKLAEINSYNDAEIKKVLDANQTVINQQKCLITEKQKILSNLIWFFISFLFSCCEITFLFLTLFKVNLNLGFNTTTNKIIFVPSLYFLIAFLILNLLPFLFLYLYFLKNKLFKNSCFNFISVFLINYFSFISFFYFLYKRIKALKEINLKIHLLQNQILEQYTRSNLFYLVLVGILLAVFLLVKYLFSLFRVFSGWSIEVDVMVYALCILVIYQKKANFLFCFLAPLLGLIFSAGGMISFFQAIIEYILTYWIFIPLVFFPNLSKIIFNHDYFSNSKKNQKFQKFLIVFAFSILLLFLYCIKLFIHIWAGVVWWTNGDWSFSALLNAQVILGSFAICLPFGLLAVLPILKLRYFYFEKSVN